MNSENGKEQHEYSYSKTEHLPSLGKEFKDQRESRKLSLEQAAVDLHIDKRFLRAIEKDDFAAIGQRVFIHGYVSNYARYLGLNQNLVMEMLEPYLAHIDYRSRKPKFLDQGSHSVEPLNYAKASLHLNSSSSQRGSNFVWAGMVLLLVLLAGGAFFGYVSLTDGDTASQFIEINPAAQIDLDLQNSQAQAPANTTEVLLPAANPDPVLAEPGAATAVTAEDIDRPDQPERGNTAGNALDTARQINSDALVNEGDAQLLFTITQKNWIEVRRNDGSVIISQLFNRGDNPLLLIKLPVDVIIGNASSTTLTLNGLTIQLEESTTNNVARLRIPR